LEIGASTLDDALVALKVVAESSSSDKDGSGLAPGLAFRTTVWPIKLTKRRLRSATECQRL